MEFQDYYKTLGVSRDASEKEIHRAFRKLARQHHPDLNPNDAAAEARFKAINEAHEVLGDPEKRKQYDRFGADWQRYQQSGAAAQEGADFSQWFTGRPGRTRVEYHEANGSGAGDFSDFFESLFGGRTRSRAMPQRGQDQEYEVELTLEEVDRGTTRLLDLQLTDQCPVCQGGGISGGRICGNCQGAGWIARTKRLEARIPPGMPDGGRVRLAGQGGAGAFGGPSGDLYLRVRILPHPRFERDGANLRTTVEVPLYTAMLGGEVMVPGLAGQLALRIPPETQNGRTFRLRGKGLARDTAGNRGDLLARVQVVLPTGLSERERELFGQLRVARERQAAHAGD